MLANAFVVIIVQYMNVSNQHIVYLKLIKCYMSTTSQKTTKFINTIFKVKKKLILLKLKRCLTPPLPPLPFFVCYTFILHYKLHRKAVLMVLS